MFVVIALAIFDFRSRYGLSVVKYLNIRKKFVRGALCGLTAGIVALFLWGSGWLDIWEAESWDWRVSLLAKPGTATDEIRLILLDQQSLDWAENENGIPWPWPREFYAAIINFCRRSRAKALAFDVLFTEFSQYGVEDDTALGTAIAEFSHFAAPVFLGKETGSEQHWPDEFPAPAFSIDGLETWLNNTEADGITFPRAVIPIPEVIQNSNILCNVQHTPDPDGVFRQLKPFNLFDKKFFPTLGLGIYLAVHHDVHLQIQPGKFIVGEKTIPIDRDGNVVLRYRGPGGTHVFYNAAEILQAASRIINEEEPTEKDTRILNDLAGKYILFGFSAPGLKDLRPAPVSGVYSGVEINATMLDNLLSGDFIAKIPTWVTTMLVLLVALTCGILTSRYTQPLHNVLIGFLFVAAPLLLSLRLYQQGYWLPLAVQEVVAALTILGSLVVNYITEGKQKRFIKHAFRQYLSPAVIDQLIQHPEQLKLGGERKELSIFFSDIQGFTSISERLEPEPLTALLNEFLSAMTDIIHEEGGTIDKYEGDAIIAFWNAPLNIPDHAIRVVRAALRCQQKLAEMRPELLERTGKELFMRVGMNTGPAVVGNMGSHSRFDYTMLGDTVNLASRLEGVNKQFGTYTMISQSTLDQLNTTFAVRELARVAVVGRKEPVTVYEPMFHEEYEARKETLEKFVKGLQLFYRGSFTHAQEIFSSISDVDPPAAAYYQKCRECRLSPPTEWRGVWVMASK